MNRAPLEDPSYEPEHQPVDGKIPEAVNYFGPRTQIRWFVRFLDVLDRNVDLSGYYVISEKHKGPCCGSCIGEFRNGYGGVIEDGWCCCRDTRIRRGNNE